jgi:hypothetical protein
VVYDHVVDRTVFGVVSIHFCLLKIGY